MTGVQPHQARVQPSQRVEAKLSLPDGAEADILRVGDPEVGVNVFEVPFERLALEAFA